MKCKKLTALLLTAAMTASVLVGCGGTQESTSTGGSEPAETPGGGQNETAESSDGGSKDIIDFTMFIAMPGSEINDGNEIQEIIAQKTGVRVKETWLTGQTAAEAVGTIIAGGEYPDFIDGGDGQMALYDAGALVAWDDYLDKYPNLKEMYSDEAGSIGKRYRREDEIGTPYCVTVDFDTLEDDTVTIRDRDTMEQVRVKIDDVEKWIEEKIEF